MFPVAPVNVGRMERGKRLPCDKRKDSKELLKQISVRKVTQRGDQIRGSSERFKSVKRNNSLVSVYAVFFRLFKCLTFDLLTVSLRDMTLS